MDKNYPIDVRTSKPVPTFEERLLFARQLVQGIVNLAKTYASAIYRQNIVPWTAPPQEQWYQRTGNEPPSLWAEPKPQWSMGEIQNLWHGSPYQFTQFANKAIGTGEGTQAFGYGHYLTNVKEVAKDYARAKNYRKPIFPKGWREDPSKLEPYPQYVYKGTAFKGKDPSEYKLLDWYEKPDESIINKVINSAKEIWKNNPDKKVFGYYPDEISQLRARLRGGRVQGLYKTIARELGSEKAASEYLREIGVYGIRYPVGSLSGIKSKSGEFNYVIFDEADIVLQKRYKLK